jgi:hypothetical protein
MHEIVYDPIGVVHTLFKDAKGIPNHPTTGKDVGGL